MQHHHNSALIEHYHLQAVRRNATRWTAASWRLLGRDAQQCFLLGAGGDWGARAAAYDGLRLLLWEARRGAAPALAAEAGALLPLLAEHLGALLGFRSCTHQDG